VEEHILKQIGYTEEELKLEIAIMLFTKESLRKASSKWLEK